MTFWTSIQSPIGPLTLVAAGGALRGVYMHDHRGAGAPIPEGAARRPDEPALRQAARELDEYFARARRRFTVPLAPQGTEFQRAVWSALTGIDFGVTRSYADIARAIGRPTATRAVGAANGQNPISIIIPCHRVVGSDGSLTGYGGGLERKRWLLAHEGPLALPF
jgi:methylated-DNA-[protein]-cysteine S-methyltransferase